VTAESRNQFELLPNEFVIVDAAIRASSDGVGSKSLIRFWRVANFPCSCRKFPCYRKKFPY
jgi:hypothetical protein